jgi:hypothetical protein
MQALLILDQSLRQARNCHQNAGQQLFRNSMRRGCFRSQCLWVGIKNPFANFRTPKRFLAEKSCTSRTARIRIMGFCRVKIISSKGFHCSCLFYILFLFGLHRGTDVFCIFCLCLVLMSCMLTS